MKPKNCRKPTFFSAQMQSNMAKFGDLLRHQRQVFEIAQSGKLPASILLWWAMGSGKSLGGLLAATAATHNLHAGKPCRILVLCDKSIVGQYSKTVKAFLASQWSSPNLTVEVQHYEILTPGRQDGRTVKPSNYACVIADEAHRFRYTFSEGTVDDSEEGMHRTTPKVLRAWIEAILKCPRIVYMTGTPLIGSPVAEMKSWNEMLRTRKDGPLNGRIFYFDPADNPKYAAYFAKVTIKTNKIPMSQAQQLLYFANKASHFRITIDNEVYEIVRPVKNTFNTKLISTSNNPFDDPSLSPKIVALLERLSAGWKKNEKIIVYSQRLETGIKALHQKWLKKMVIDTQEQMKIKNASNSEIYRATKDITERTLLISGAQSIDDRTKAMETFNGQREITTPRVLFISDAGGQGIDLKNATTVLLFEPPDRLATQRQIINRAVRYKSHSAKDAEVSVEIFCSTFSPTSDKGPLAKTASSLGICGENGRCSIEQASNRTYQTNLLNAIKRLISNEKLTIDEKTMKNRERIDERVQKGLEDLKTYARHFRTAHEEKQDAKAERERKASEAKAAKEAEKAAKEAMRAQAKAAKAAEKAAKKAAKEAEKKAKARENARKAKAPKASSRGSRTAPVGHSRRKRAVTVR